jgi:hypothetical protein
MKYDELIHDYEVDVEFPEVSGIEHLDMLLARSDIANIEQELTEEQRQRVSNADQQLIEHAQQFYEAIQRIASLEQWRQQHNVHVTHWWWYLDVIAQLTTAFSVSVAPIFPAASSQVLETVVDG